eukprot:2997184-Prymnesium_polylepis.1
MCFRTLAQHARRLGRHLARLSGVAPLLARMCDCLFRARVSDGTAHSTLSFNQASKNPNRKCPSQSSSAVVHFSLH